MISNVSVAMAVYNGGMYLKPQIESILSQLLPDDELVVSYDISSDDSLSIIQDYCNRDHRVVLVHNDRGGIVANFNNAIKHCKNDAIFISDQDDLWLPNKRQKVVEALNRTGADLVIHNGVHINENDEVISDSFFEMYKIGNSLLRNFVAPRYSGCCMAFSRKAMTYLYPMPLEVINYDHWIGMACQLFGTVSYLDEVLLQHRLHGSNATTSRRGIKVIAAQRSELVLKLIQRKLCHEERE